MLQVERASSIHSAEHGHGRASTSSTKQLDDSTSLTSFNPFSEEDEHDQSGYALVTSLFSRVKTSISNQLASAAGTGVSSAVGGGSIYSGIISPTSPNANNQTSGIQSGEASRKPSSGMQGILSPRPTNNGFSSRPNLSKIPSAERPGSLTLATSASKAAPPLVSLTPVISEVPTFEDRPTSRASAHANFFFSPTSDNVNNGADNMFMYGTSIPGFPIQDDARSVRTSGSLTRPQPVAKVFRKIRGEGLSKDYWMDDQNCAECYDCKSPFSTWRRKHHCRICGQIFCSRCASNIIKGNRFGADSTIRVCNLCLEKLEQDDDDEDDRKSTFSFSGMSTNSPGHTQRFMPHQHGHSYSYSGLAQSHTLGDSMRDLHAIMERRRVTSFGSDDGSYGGSRPLTPRNFGKDLDYWDESNNLNGSLSNSISRAAPFRRRILEDENDEAVDVPNFGPRRSSGSGSGSESSPDGDQNPIPISVVGASTTSLEGSGVSSVITTGNGNGGGTKSSITFPGMSGMSPERDRPPLSVNGIATPRRMSLMRSRVNSYADTLDGAGGTVPFLRSRVQSRLSDSFDGPGDGWRTRRESTYAQELNALSMFHLRIMLRQMLNTPSSKHPEPIPNIKEWEETLFRLALQISRDLTFLNSQPREGIDMDVRRYVKIKKIPGGAPRDSEYVDGAVITKNVAHKRMNTAQKNVRIMHVTFPLDFQRVEGKYIPFGQVLTQEQQYIENLTSRIAHFSPHLVLVERGVSRLALEALVKQGIAVARSVKPSAVQFVARMTQGDLISSIDKLMLEPRLGHCSRYRTQTFDHPLIPGRRKTYMRFEGCGRNMGCTIILRGGNIDLLRRIKEVTRFLIFVVRNLKMETSLWKDAVVTLPLLTADAVPIPGPMRPRSLSLGSGELLMSPGRIRDDVSRLPRMIDAAYHGESAIASDDDERIVTRQRKRSNKEDSTIERDLAPEDLERHQLSKRIRASMEPYEKTFISVSATLRFQPPHPIRHMKELDDKLRELRKVWEDNQILRHERLSSNGVLQTPMPVHDREATVTPSSASLSFDVISPMVPPVAPTSGQLPTAVEAGDYFSPQHVPSASSSLESDSRFSTPTPGTVELPKTKSEDLEHSTVSLRPSSSSTSLTSTRDSVASLILQTPMIADIPQVMALKQVSDIADESALSLVQLQHDEERRVWEWYLRKNADDFIVDKYQSIFIREYIAPITDEGAIGRACFIPHLQGITFYGENDCMLGQFMEKAINEGREQLNNPKAVCNGKSCGRHLLSHRRMYLHNEDALSITVVEADAAKTGYAPYPDVMVTWSVCRLCQTISPCLPTSEEMQKYSFGKFLELHFYPADVTLIPELKCAHNIYQNHIRHISYKGMTVCIQTDSIKLQEIIFPPLRIRIRPESLLQLRNSDYERMLVKNLMWYSSLIDDLRLISIDASTGDEDADAKLLHDVNLLILRAEFERNEIANMIHIVYRDTSPTDTLALNSVRRHRQDKMVAWQQDFDRLPKPRQVPAPIEKDRRSTTFGSVRNMFPKRSELVGLFDPFPGSRDSDAESLLFRRRFVSDASTSASETEGLPDPTREKITRLSEQAQLLEKAAATSRSETKEHSGLLRAELMTLPPVDEVPKSDAESDDTIGAAAEPTERWEGQGTGDSEATVTSISQVVPSPPHRESLIVEGLPVTADERTPPPASRLPRPSDNQLSVAQLIQRYQMPLGVNVPLAPLIPSDSQIPGYADSEADSELPPMRLREGHRHKPHKRRSSITEEEGYAANVAPRYLGHSHRRQTGTRIPGPHSAYESHESSRQASPDKRAFSDTGHHITPKASHAAPTRSSKNKSVLRHTPRERNPMIRTTSSGLKTMSRRKTSYTQPGKVNTLTKQFEKMSRDGDRLNRRYSVIRGRRARPVASAKAKVEVFDNVRDAIQDESESSDDEEADDEEDERGMDESTTNEKQESPTRTEAEACSVDSVTEDSSASSRKSSLDTGPRSPPINVPDATFSGTPTQTSETPATTSITSSLEQLPASGADASSLPERQSLVNAFSKLWPEQAISSRLIAEVESEDPLADPEHIFRESDIVVRTDEPTSIIALTLDSPKYKEDLARQRQEKRPRMEASEAFMPDESVVTDSQSNWGVVNFDSDQASKSSSQYSFESSGITITCTVLFAEQFDSHRRDYDCDSSMIESLARCVKWDNRGGKSGSGFLKTRDDRFIAKELSKAELNAMETFAPAYFEYMAGALAAGRPTLLAKLFGCYKITFKHEAGHKSKTKARRMNLLVMENLFYDRRFSKIYDLKGSTRNRHVQSTGRENEVLLDENLVQVAHLSPFYLREHSKRILRGALWNDSRFLAELNVMDYSLIVGVDTHRNELVLGIVDYIRTYTWDKKLETWVKESTFLGGQGKGEPTIVTPKQYKSRFRSAMERYFPLVPDRWMKQRDAPDQEGDSLLDLWPDW